METGKTDKDWISAFLCHSFFLGLLYVNMMDQIPISDLALLYYGPTWNNNYHHTDQQVKRNWWAE